MAHANGTPQRTVVAGTFDFLRAFHVRQLDEARRLVPQGELHVLVWDDCSGDNISTLFPLTERVFMLQNLKQLASVRACSSESMETALDALQPTVYFRNKNIVCVDNHPLRFALGESCKRRGIRIVESDADLEVMEFVEEEVDAVEWRKDKKVVMVSGCYDLLHSGHLAFFKEASALGDLFVSVGNDVNIEQLKHHRTMFPEGERLYLVNAIKHVSLACVSKGMGMLDFERDLAAIRPDIFFVNKDGARESKEIVCKKYGVKYVVSERIPEKGLEERSSTSIKAELEAQRTLVKSITAFPWRICLAGGWLDQPWVSSLSPGCVIVVNVLPNYRFQPRSGLATSSRKVGIKLWGTDQFHASGEVCGPPRTLDEESGARMLFGAENPPGSDYVSGSQDALGLMLTGVSKLHFCGGYWPSRIEKLESEAAIAFLESVLWLVPMAPREEGYDPLSTKNLTKQCAAKLAEASESAWNAIKGHDAASLGNALNATRQAWKQMLPATVPQECEEFCKEYDMHHGSLFTGAGGGYLMVVSSECVQNGFRIRITNPKMNIWTKRNIR